MPPEDQWEQYLKKPSTPAGDDQWEQFRKPPAHDYTQDIVDVGKGLAKGVGRYAVGAGQIGEHLFPGTAAGVRAIPGVSSAAHAAKEFVMSPNQTWGESIGDVGGEVAPWAAGALTGVDEAAGGAYLTSKIASKVAPNAAWYVTRAGQAAPYLRTKGAEWLGDLAARAGFGSAAGGLEATQQGDLASHGKGALAGGTAGAVMNPKIAGMVGRLSGTLGIGGAIEEVARATGMHPLTIAWLAGVGGWGGHHAIYNTGLAKTAQRWAEWAAKHIPSGVTGGAAGGVMGD